MQQEYHNWDDISQLIWFARAASDVSGFKNHNKVLTAKPDSTFLSLYNHMTQEWY